MPFLTQLENKFGRLAIPGLVRGIVAFQFLNWFLIKIEPSLFLKLMFDPVLILEGEVWRLVSFVIIPGSMSLLWLFFGIPFLWMISDGLEQAWGSFRLNLYVYFGMACVVAGGFITGTSGTGWYLWATLILAFAVYYPDHEILLFLILPIKMKWLAALTAAGLLFNIIGNGLLNAVFVLFSILNFLVVLGPGLVKSGIQRGKAAERRQRFKAAAGSDAAYFHKCAICGKTEVDDPTLDYRVTADGEEYCTKCKPPAPKAP